MFSAIKYNSRRWSNNTLLSTTKLLYLTISYIILLSIVEGKLSGLKCSTNQRSMCNSCLYKSNSTCCPTYNGDSCLRELSRLDWASPGVEFRDNSISVDEKRNRICVQGLKAKSAALAKLENWWSLEGFNFQVTVESMYLIGSNMAEFMLVDENRRANGAPILEDLIMCFPVGADYDIWKLRQYENVYLFLTLIPLPPALTSEPIDYQGNPIQLSTLPEIDLKTDGKCRVISTHVTPVTIETTPSWFDEPLYQVVLVLAAVIILICCSVSLTSLVLFVVNYCKTRVNNNNNEYYRPGVGVDNAVEMKENDTTVNKKDQTVSVEHEDRIVFEEISQVVVQDEGPNNHSTL